MLILGVAGGIDLQFEKGWRQTILGTTIRAHDAAAVLIEDGKVVAAIEEERLNRIKHSDKAPISAVRFCLDSCQVKLKDIDLIAVNGEEKYQNINSKIYYLEDPQGKALVEPRTVIRNAVRTACGEDLDDRKVAFVNHHLAHAMSAFYMSGFENSLVLTIDGHGDGISGMVMDASPTKSNILANYSFGNSLGNYYVSVIRFLGYRQHDEYKVMGLAPYGDPERYWSIFKQFYTLGPDGNYTIHLEALSLLHSVLKPRRKNEPFTQVHKDLAASLQLSLENIVFHVLRHYQGKTKHTNLCLAGGVTHNCSVNGKVLYSKLFENIFVQPAAHDAGCALGAALYLYYKNKPQAPKYKLEAVYWGTDIGADQQQLDVIKKWTPLIQFERTDQIVKKTAQLLAEGSVIGWIQGKSEFGPRALGNRSIVADPRPAENKDIINAMVKKRESYRPFAPSILEEYVGEYYEITPKMKQFPYMNFVLRTHEDKRSLLGAITHVDGTARVQTVSQKTNPLYWELIDEFRKLTGVPILLNTSFNNNAEPIVDSVYDAIVCFLTTKLDYLVIGNYFIKKQAVKLEDYLYLIPSLPVHVVLNEMKQYIACDETASIFEISSNDDYDRLYQTEISIEVFQILQELDGGKRQPARSLGDLIHELGMESKTEPVVSEIIKLWTSRFIQLTPPGK